MMFVEYLFRDAYDEIEKAERKRKKIERIAQRAEAMQRYQKGGHFK